MGHVESFEDDAETIGLDSPSYTTDLCYIVLQSRINYQVVKDHDSRPWRFLRLEDDPTGVFYGESVKIINRSSGNREGRSMGSNM